MQETIQKLAQSVLDNGYFLSIATQDKNGLWVGDVLYVADDDWNIYWLSANDVRRSKAIMENPDVAGTITISADLSDPSEALQIAGTAQKVENAEEQKKVEELFLQKRGKEKNAQESRYNENLSWYKLTPTKMRLSHEPTFGREKQDVEIR